jgi:hypothetical protein
MESIDVSSCQAEDVKRLIVPALSLEVKSASIYKRSSDPGGWECISSLSFQQKRQASQEILMCLVSEAWNESSQDSIM